MQAEFTGKLHNVTRDFFTKRPIVSFLIDQDISEVVDTKESLSIKVKPNRRKRSLDANAYFHVLCQKIADRMVLPMSTIKNMMITDFGQPEIVDGEIIEYITNAPPHYIEKQEAVHLKFIGIAPDLNYRYRVYRGSHTYDTAEMHKLIEGTVAEAKAQGIETATPNELIRMEMLWEKRKKL